MIIPLQDHDLTLTCLLIKGCSPNCDSQYNKTPLSLSQGVEERLAISPLSCPSCPRSQRFMSGGSSSAQASALPTPVAASQRGSRQKNKACKIDAEIARAIYQAKPPVIDGRIRRDGVSNALARQYGITAKAVRDIWNGRTWASETGQSRKQADDSPQTAGTGGDQGGAGITSSAGASPELGHNKTALVVPEHSHLFPWAPPTRWEGWLMPELAMDRHPVQDPASGPLSFRPSPAAQPEGAIGFREARDGGCDHWHTGLGRSFGAQEELRNTVDANEPVGIRALPIMRQHSWPPMGHAQGHTGTAGNIIARAYPAIGHTTATHVERGSSPAQLSQAQCAAAVPAMQQQDLGPRIHDLPAPTANVLVSSFPASPSSAQASASRVGAGNPGGVRASPAPGHHAAAHDTPEKIQPFLWAPPNSLGWLGDAGAFAMGSFMEDDIKSTAQDTMAHDTEDAVINFLPFTFEQALNTLSRRPLLTGFHIPDESADLAE
jgi:hypothetical protein